LRILYSIKTKKLSTDFKSVASISRVIRVANRHSGAKVVLNLKKTAKADGNLTSVYAALNCNLNKSRNRLRILSRKANGTDITLRRDMFGYVSGWEDSMAEDLCLGGTRAFAFNPSDKDAFVNYLLHDAFRKDWKLIIPYYYKTKLKSFLRNLFQNACDHSDSNGPIFFSSAFNDKVLRFTVSDCGQGFLLKIGKDPENIINDEYAISSILNKRNLDTMESDCLKSLGDYCVENGGELSIISGGVIVRYDKKGFHQSEWLPGAFRGSIINISVKIAVPEFFDVPVLKDHQD
jgi:hypothetical protein